jgi:hypothetical protein
MTRFLTLRQGFEIFLTNQEPFICVLAVLVVGIFRNNTFEQRSPLLWHNFLCLAKFFAVVSHVLHPLGRIMGHGFTHTFERFFGFWPRCTP